MPDIFVGFVYDQRMEKTLIESGQTAIQAAANQYQMGFISGISEIEILSALSVGYFPNKNKKLFYKGSVSKTKSGTIHYIPFVNFYLIRDWMQAKEIKKELIKIISRQNHTTVYVYSLYVPFLKAIKKIKKKFGELVHVCLIIPDLPGKYGLMRKWYTPGGIRDFFELKIKMDFPNQYADSFVFLTDAMHNLFSPKPYVVIEGFLPQVKYDYSQKRISKTILYTGSLNESFGIRTLLEAFEQIKDRDYKLWICGAGGIQNIVETYAKNDCRITYFGFLPKERICGLQTKCDVLINPRQPDGEYTRYSFPSKTMEYLLSGSKVLMYRLPGIGEEYYQYIRIIQGNDPHSLADAILAACTDTSFYEQNIWKNQIDWIRSHKNVKNQIIKMNEALSHETNT